MAEPRHPLDALTDGEIRETVRLLRDAGHADEETLFPSIALREMDKARVLAWRRGDPIRRAAEVVLLRDGQIYEAQIDLTDGRLDSVHRVVGARPPLMAVETPTIVGIVKGDARWQAAMRARGITSLEHIVCIPLPTGLFVAASHADRRVVRVVCREPGGKYSHIEGRPIEGLHAVVDIEAGAVLDVVDAGPVPVTEFDALRESRPRNFREQMNPVFTISPHGGNFQFLGTLEVDWEKWAFHVRMDGRVGPIISLVKYQDGDRVRDIAYQLTLGEIFVPYMDPAPNWRFRALLDAGEFRGLGHLAASLIEGVDCPPQAAYVTPTLADEFGKPYHVERALCIFEEALDGPLWRHGGGGGSAADGRPAVQLVVRSVSHLANYDYVIDWVFTQHGEIHVRVGATGVNLVKGVEARSMADPTASADTAHGELVAPMTVAPWHDHYFGFRLDLDVDGVDNTLVRDDLTLIRFGADNPRRSGWVLRSTPVETEGPVAPLRQGGALRIVNERAPRTPLGHMPAYQLAPGQGGLSLLAEDDVVQARAAFSASRVWLTARKAEERYPAGDYPNQATGGLGLPQFSTDGDPVHNQDLVLWVTLGFNHLTRVEDWPLMPTRWHSFVIRPYNFFDESPAFDVPAGFRGTRASAADP